MASGPEGERRPSPRGWIADGICSDLRVRHASAPGHHWRLHIRQYPPLTLWCSRGLLQEVPVICHLLGLHRQHCLSSDVIRKEGQKQENSRVDSVYNRTQTREGKLYAKIHSGTSQPLAGF
jgi:hypothetical protein